ncbi:AT-rich interactive domain-containing protein 1A-like [Abrus precatorius]|uniref:AT-rich interactive domain-containing protein 1A-like n=1 Tax=Abrus precatorius TaxID=3816 RepID=A0A8B8LFY1_ABRPR|nr:AT-rich interactive domain-containing protein 1A-like [Abrus precatorius]XP_027354219.1 AT-rich interactive domain-containing protein 1A-like [Abrus precatorius]
MGFDNECIVNIQSLAGEYFCPVCRLLVFPNEALQSQCTHLYCKPCLTYVVSTTRACPYDGYLVTEADSKPLIESNKALAETIGKIPVHCLYHRSGCTWQGTLSECTSHCSGCAYGNSPVVCNRCGIQIVHRQVQEHAQNCPGVQGQVQQVAITQDPSATSAVASTDQTQAAAPVGTTASQALPSQTAVTTTAPAHASNQLTNPASQSQAVVQTVVQPTAEQWYQQQQYQQYYQQYPGQDPYQQQYQNYYPYQQSAVPQYQQAYGQPQHQSQSQPQAQLQPQPLAQLQPQPQPQAQNQSQPQQPQPQVHGLSQPLSHVQAPVAPPSQNQVQVHQQPQQFQPFVQPHGQTSHPPVPSQSLPQPQPQPYPYPQVQPHSVQPQPQQHMQMPPYQQPLPQMQHSQPQIQQPVQKYPVPQSQVHPQLHPHQPPMHPHQPVAPNVQPQVQNATSHAVTGHQSYPQPLPHHNTQPGVPQHAMHMHPQAGPQPQGQHPVQTQSQFPPQIPMMRPNQSHAMFPNQQQPALVPSPVRGQTTPPMQHQPVYTHNQQPGQINQRPFLQPIQQIPPQPFSQHQAPMPSHLRPQGSANSFPKHAYPQSQGNTALSNSSHLSQSQNAVGRPLLPNHAGHIQPYAQSANTIPVRHGQNGAGFLPENQNLLIGANNQVQLPSELQSRPSEPIERHNVNEQKTDSSSGKHSKNFKDLDTVSGSASELKSDKVETDFKPIEVGNKQHSEDPHSVKTLLPSANALENGDSVNKNHGIGEATESNWKPSSGNKSGGVVTGVQNGNDEHSVRGNEFQDGPLPKTEAKVPESEIDKLHKDDTCTPRPHPGAGTPTPSVSQSNEGFAQLSHHATYTDQTKHQQPMINFGPASVQKRQLPHSAVPNQPLSEGNSSTLVRNHGPAHAFHSGQPLTENFQPTMFKQLQDSDIQFNTPGRSFQPQSHGPSGPYNQVHEPPFHSGASNLSHIGGPQFGAPLPGDMHGRVTANLPPHAPEGFGLQDERFKPFHAPNQQNIDRREFEDDLKKFPRLPLDAEPVSKFGNYSLGPHEAGKRPVGYHDDVIKKSGPTLHPGYLGPDPGYGRHHMDGMAPRSPVNEYSEMSSRRLGPHSGGLVGKSGIDDFDGRVARRFGEFRDSRFPHLPSHLHRDEFDGFGSFRMGEHPRSGDFIGHGEFGGHFRRGEHLGPHNFSRHLQLGEAVGFGAHPGHMRAVELGSSRTYESFSKGNRPGHPQLGEPGFRSSFSLSGFPNDAGFLTGDIRSFDNLRRRKASSMGWCRICKLDCGTVEGLDLHSQTREHQKMAMDIVKTIKQNAKKQKLIASEQHSVDEGNKTWNTGFEGRGSKH